MCANTISVARRPLSVVCTGDRRKHAPVFMTEEDCDPQR